MPHLNVTYQDIHDRAARLSGAKADLDTRLAEIDAVIKSLIIDGFVTDSASGAFESAAQEVTSGANHLTTGLASVVSFLERLAQTLQDVDSQLAQQLGE
jgi:uncharacterized protein YukE